MPNQKSTKIVYFLLGIAACSTAAVLLVSQRRAKGDHTFSVGGSSSTSADDGAADLETLRREVRELRRVTGALAARPLTVAAAKGNSGDPAEESGSISPEQLAAEEARERDQTEHRFAALEETFHQQRPDPGIAETNRKALVEAMKSAPGGTNLQLDQLECGDRLCRAEFLLGAPEAHSFIPLIANQVKGFSGGTLRRITGPDGKQRTVAFLARQGHDLPATD
jgi:hypothetical protein